MLFIAVPWIISWQIGPLYNDTQLYYVIIYTLYVSLFADAIHQWNAGAKTSRHVNEARSRCLPVDDQPPDVPDDIGKDDVEEVSENQEGMPWYHSLTLYDSDESESDDEQQDQLREHIAFDLIIEKPQDSTLDSDNESDYECNYSSDEYPESENENEVCGRLLSYAVWVNWFLTYFIFRFDSEPV